MWSLLVDPHRNEVLVVERSIAFVDEASEQRSELRSSGGLRVDQIAEQTEQGVHVEIVALHQLTADDRSDELLDHQTDELDDDLSTVDRL